ncbi:MAG: hypothetical protein AMJ91_03245 [candidate division Zixibacteria bacterium SM23_73_3]|nr:MAG: hypothetical protein AMJ91_03245 [candidate division Zixibacteria bacterium SM23_73_3]
MRKLLYLFLLFVVLADTALAGVSVVGGLTREKALEPGAKFEGTIKLQNTGETTCQVSAYQTDYLFYADGSNVYGEPGSAVRSNADWLTISPKRLTIPPGEEASVYYSGQVPEIKELASIHDDVQLLESPSLVGTYWSMVMIEPEPETGPESVEGEAGKVKIGIQTKVRYGIQIVTHIGDTGIRKIRFLDRRLANQEGQITLQLGIENIGERWLSPTVWVELYDDEGIEVGRFEAGKKRIYPHCSVRHEVDLSGVPKGNYKALVVVDNGDEYVFGARYDLGIE